MSVQLNTISPMGYNEWLSNQTTLNPALAQIKYVEYLNEWYRVQGIKNSDTTNKLKGDYIQLIKDLSFLFGKKEKDQFLADIDFSNDEELIFSIPFFAKKLKEIALLLSRKRETIKEAKLKYNLIGSNNGLERLLYEYILKGFTKSENGITQIPTYHLSDMFPELSAIKDNFFIEVEELHDSNTYYDSDPSVGINEYVNVDDLVNEIPFEGLTEDEIIGLISTRYLPRVAETPLSNLFNKYLMDESIINTGVSLSSLSALTINELNASLKYLSEKRYGLTAIRLKDVYLPDKNLIIDFPVGNTWFLWPTGDRILNDLEFNNTYLPININASNFLGSGATAGSSMFISDLIFTEKNGTLEGAWLNGTKVLRVKDNLELTIERNSYKDFIFPFVGFNVTPKGNNFSSYSIKDDIFEKFNLFETEKKKELLANYYTSNLPNSGSHIIYLNQTKLVYQGAHAAKYPDEADCVTSKYKINNIIETYNDFNNGVLEEAFLFKFDETDLVIKEGLTNIQWPIQTFNTSDNLPTSITIKSDTCLPVILGETNPSKHMLGSVAGFDFNTSDVIYKLSNDTDEPIEAAWLGGQSVNNLDLNYKSIKIYDASAVKCSVYNDGPIQPSLSFKVKPSEKISFIWGDIDTPANDVFKFIEHSSNCLYGKNDHDYYEDQDFRNPNPLFFKNHWTECTCKSTINSPIGHIGKKFVDYNATTDFIFADPDGNGADFAINTWSDTRNLDYEKSPQFAFYQLDGKSNDTPVGWGTGKWKTSTNIPFILKTGRRYTYSRSSFRKSKTSADQSPYLITKYPYKEIVGYYSLNKPSDVVILLDISRSQTTNIAAVKDIVSNLSKKILSDTNDSTQVSVVTFGSYSSIISLLSKDIDILDLYIKSINIPKDIDLYKTNILDALQVANYILSTNTELGASNSLKGLCNNLNFVTSTPSIKSKFSNVPRDDASKKIILFTNGLETISIDLAEPYARELKNNGFKIFVADVGVKKPEDYDVDICKKIVSSNSTYFNLEKYLLTGDTDINSFSEYMSYRLGDQIPIKPSWNKAIRNSEGAWVSTSEASDMVLNPGDYLIYVHRNGIDYDSITEQVLFTTPSINFTINLKLDGWDYRNNYFSFSAIGLEYGAKPYWAKVFTDINLEKNFIKETSKSGGNVYYISEYVPVYQPEISNMVLGTGDFIRYKRIEPTNFKWIQPLTFNVTLTANKWKKIKISKEYSNIQKSINRNKLDIIGEPTDEESDLILESYSQFNPAVYNYYARKEFTFNQDLFLVKRCADSFVTYTTGVVLNPIEPYANILNVHFPTVASISFPSKSFTSKDMGEYLLPDKLGVSSYRGRGYTIEIDNDSLTQIDSMSAERIFIDLGKYGPRQRGLTKKDQITPVKITNIDNSWIHEPYGRAERSGVLINTRENQKFTPYSTSYESENENKYGVTRQSDLFQFWTPAIPAIWNEPQKYPLTLRKEVLPQSYEQRKKIMLVDAGELHTWRTDIYGNDYGLFKQITPISLEGLLVWYKSTTGTLSANGTATGENGDVIRWLDKSGNGKHLGSYSGILSGIFSSQTTSPILSSNVINGKPALYFNGTASLYSQFNLIQQNGLTVYVVGQFLNNDNTFSAKNYQPMVSISLSSENTQYKTQYFNNETFTLFSKYGKNAFGFGNPYIDSEAPTVSGSPIELAYNRDFRLDLENSNSGFKVFEFVFDIPTATTYINKEYYLGLDDLNQTFNKHLFSSAGSNSTGGLWVGSYGGGQFPTKCYISEIFIFDRALTSQERLDMENYLGSEYKLF